MSWTRWKLTGGGLVLSLGGLAAVAGVPGAVTPKGGKVACAAPVALPVPNVAKALPIPELPAVPSVGTPADVTVVSGSTAPVVIEAAPPARPLPNPAPQPMTKELSLPVTFVDVPTPAPAPTPPAPAPVAQAPAVPVAPPVPAPAPAPVPAPPPVQQSIPLTPIVEAAPAPAPVPAPIAEVKPIPPATTPAPTRPVARTTTTEKKLKVMLHMGDERPRFEVRDGEESYLKVVCEKVDVKSPSEKGETMSTLKASGKVTFVTPGGEGVCDELTVAPGTGLVVVTGNVHVKYNWGKVETTLSGDRMTFRLGSTPGVNTESNTLPASFQTSR